MGPGEAKRSSGLRLPPFNCSGKERREREGKLLLVVVRRESQCVSESGSATKRRTHFRKVLSLISLTNDGGGREVGFVLMGKT